MTIEEYIQSLLDEGYSEADAYDQAEEEYGTDAVAQYVYETAFSDVGRGGSPELPASWDYLSEDSFWDGAEDYIGQIEQELAGNPYLSGEDYATLSDLADFSAIISNATFREQFGTMSQGEGLGQVLNDLKDFADTQERDRELDDIVEGYFDEREQDLIANDPDYREFAQQGGTYDEWAAQGFAPVDPQSQEVQDWGQAILEGSKGISEAMEAAAERMRELGMSEEDISKTLEIMQRDIDAAENAEEAADFIQGIFDGIEIIGTNQDQETYNDPTPDSTSIEDIFGGFELDINDPLEDLINTPATIFRVLKDVLTGNDPTQGGQGSGQGTGQTGGQQGGGEPEDPPFTVTPGGDLVLDTDGLDFGDNVGPFPTETPDVTVTPGGDIVNPDIVIGGDGGATIDDTSDIIDEVFGSGEGGVDLEDLFDEEGNYVGPGGDGVPDSEQDTPSLQDILNGIPNLADILSGGGIQWPGQPQTGGTGNDIFDEETDYETAQDVGDAIGGDDGVVTLPTGDGVGPTLESDGSPVNDTPLTDEEIDDLINGSEDDIDDITSDDPDMDDVIGEVDDILGEGTEDQTEPPQEDDPAIPPDEEPPTPPAEPPDDGSGGEPEDDPTVLEPEDTQPPEDVIQPPEEPPVAPPEPPAGEPPEDDPVDPIEDDTPVVTPETPEPPVPPDEEPPPVDPTFPPVDETPEPPVEPPVDPTVEPPLEPEPPEPPQEEPRPGVVGRKLVDERVDQFGIDVALGQYMEDYGVDTLQELLQQENFYEDLYSDTSADLREQIKKASRGEDYEWDQVDTETNLYQAAERIAQRKGIPIEEAIDIAIEGTAASRDQEIDYTDPGFQDWLKETAGFVLGTQLIEQELGDTQIGDDDTQNGDDPGTDEGNDDIPTDPPTGGTDDPTDPGTDPGDDDIPTGGGGNGGVDGGTGGGGNDDPPITGGGDDDDTGDDDVPDGGIDWGNGDGEFQISDLWDGLVNWFSNGGANAAAQSVVNFYGAQEAADSYREAAQAGIDEARAAREQLRDDLEPYRTAGESVIDETVQAARDTPSPDDLPGFREQYELNPEIDPGVSEEELRNALFQGFENLPDLVAETGDVEGLITRGSDEWNILQDDIARQVNNAQAARGKLGSGGTVDLMTEALIKNIGNIEGINNQRIGNELAQRTSDFNISRGARQQLGGEQIAESQILFDQLSNMRGQIMAEQGLEFEQTRQANDQMFGQDSSKRSQLWNELLQEDYYNFSQPMQIATMGANAANRSGQAGFQALPTITSGMQLGAAGNAQQDANRAQLWESLIGSIFGDSGGTNDGSDWVWKNLASWLG